MKFCIPSDTVSSPIPTSYLSPFATMRFFIASILLTSASAFAPSPAGRTTQSTVSVVCSRFSLLVVDSSCRRVSVQRRDVSPTSLSTQPYAVFQLGNLSSCPITIFTDYASHGTWDIWVLDFISHSSSFLFLSGVPFLSVSVHGWMERFFWGGLTGIVHG